MAKQRGIHQISGKVNNLCYYEQKYVRGGLIRRINDGMSLRLKQDPVFARTRDANSVFGMCSMLAGNFFAAFGYGLNEMYTPSAQSKLTTALLRIFQSQLSHRLGDVIDITVTNLTRMALEFNKLGRNYNSGLSSFFSPFYTYLKETDTGARSVTIPKESLKNYLSKYKALKLQYRVYDIFDISSPTFSSDAGKYIRGGYIVQGHGRAQYWNVNDDDLEIVLEAPSSILDYNFMMVIIYPIVPAADGSTDRYARGAFYYIIGHDE